MKQIMSQWFGHIIGARLDPDRAYGLQCVDVIDHYGEYIFRKGWTVCVGAVNGAKNLLDSMARTGYWHITRSTAGIRVGDVAVWGGDAGNPYGHTGVVSLVKPEGVWVVNQNSNGLANQAAHESFYRWNMAGIGNFLGYARPKDELMVPDPTPPAGGGGVGGSVHYRAVTASPAIIRNSPFVRSDNVAGEYPHGIANGATLAVVGYVKGQDPYPNDGVQDDAWLQTISGKFVWANGVGNNLDGLPYLGSHV